MRKFGNVGSNTSILTIFYHLIGAELFRNQSLAFHSLKLSTINKLIVPLNSLFHWLLCIEIFSSSNSTQLTFIFRYKHFDILVLNILVKIQLSVIQGFANCTRIQHHKTRVTSHLKSVKTEFTQRSETHENKKKWLFYSLHSYTKIWHIYDLKTHSNLWPNWNYNITNWKCRLLCIYEKWF